MKYLLKNLKAVACGEELEAGKNELVFDPDGTFKLAELKAIAKANGIEHGSRIKMTELVVLIAEAFEKLELKEYLDIKGIVVTGIKAGKDDDAIMMELVEAGVPFRDVVGQFRTAMMAAGLILKPAERNEKLAALLEDFEPGSDSDVSEMVALLMAEIPRTTERQAMAAIRKYAKANSIELPKVKRMGGFKKKLFDWMVENPTASVGDLASFVSEKGKPESVTKRYSEVMLLAQKMAANMPAE